MRSLKFYLWTLVIGSMTFSLNSCDKEEDDEKNEEKNEIVNDNDDDQNSDDQDLGSDSISIINTWKSVESTAKAESKDLSDDVLDLVGDYVNGDSIINLGDKLSFYEDGKLEMFYLIEKTNESTSTNAGYEKRDGNYKLNENKIEISFPDETGKLITLKDGADISSEIEEAAEDEFETGNGALKASIESMTYSLKNNKLTIQTIINCTIDFAKFLGNQDNGGYDISVVLMSLGIDPSSPASIKYTTTHVYEK